MKTRTTVLYIYALIMLLLAACGEFTVEIITESPLQVADQTTASSQPNLEDVTEAPASLPESTPTGPDDPFPALAYVGQDGNIWLRESGSAMHRQVTTDAQKFDGENRFVEYANPKLSSDGIWVAFDRDEGERTDGGFESRPTVRAVNLETREARLIYEGRLNGKAWKPGTHLLAYGVNLPGDYFWHAGERGSGWATGIQAVDLDTGENYELVSPERDYALASPNWSGNGRFLAFSEILAMEGSGNFAYYDFENQQYVAWEESLGGISWSPDGSSLTYARVTYVPTGVERLFIHNREGDEMTVGPDYPGPAYADYPTFSPRGDKIAYAAVLEGPFSGMFTVSVLNVATGELNEFGDFEDVWELAWSPDSRFVVFGFGQGEPRQIMAIDVETGNQILLAAGSQPGVAGQ